MHSKNNKMKIRSLGVFAMTLGAVSCGGGGGGGGGGSGSTGVGVASGVITNFGSLFVNGVEWTTSGADITVDGSAGNESQLRVGQVVTIRGALNASGTAGDADSVDFDNVVEGPVTSINLQENTILVLGQTVIIDADTGLDDSITDTLQAIVEVSGYRDSTGAIHATRIDTRPAVGQYEIRGTVASLNSPDTFLVNGFPVNYAAATLEDFGTTSLSNGDVVEVEGTLASGVLVATRVQLEDSLSGEAGDNGNVEGYITRFASTTNFDVAGVPVTTNSGTGYEGGTTSSLALNVKVEVEGLINDAGVIVADEVDIRVQPDDADVEIVADVASVAGDTVTLQGMNISVRVNSATRLEDKSAADVATFSLADLAVGDHVRIIGADDTSTGALNDMIATRLERDDADDETILRGPIQTEDELEASLTILGVTVATDFASFVSESGLDINEATFFSIVAPGDIVKATATPSTVGSNLFEADLMEIEETD